MVRTSRWRVRLVALSVVALTAACTSGAAQSGQPGPDGTTVGSTPPSVSPAPGGTSLAGGTGTTITVGGRSTDEPSTGVTSTTVPLDRPDGSVTWVAAGDSYSAGVGGVDGNDGTGCENRSMSESYALRAPLRLAASGAVRINELRFLACGGAVADRPDGADLPSAARVPFDDGNTIRWIQLRHVDGADVVTLTAGGNDADFSSFAQACFLPEPWKKLLEDSIGIWEKIGLALLYLSPANEAVPGVPLAQLVADLMGHDCASHDRSADDLRRVDAPRSDGKTPSDWLELRHRLVRLYADLAARAPDAEVYVLTYPVPFAAEHSWDPVYDSPKQAADAVAAFGRLLFLGGTEQDAVKAKDSAEALLRNVICAVSRLAPDRFLTNEILLANAFATRLNDEVAAAVAEANHALPAPRLHLVDWRTADDPAEAIWMQGTSSRDLAPIDGPSETSTEALDAFRAAHPDAHRIAFNPHGLCATADVLTHFVLWWEQGDSAHPTTRGYEVATDAVVRAYGAGRSTPAIPNATAGAGATGSPTAPSAAWFLPYLQVPEVGDETRAEPPRCALFAPVAPTVDRLCPPRTPPAGAPEG